MAARLLLAAQLKREKPMRCSGEIVLGVSDASVKEQIAQIAGTLRDRGAVLVRSGDCNASFSSCTLHLGRNSFVFLGKGQLAIKSEGRRKVLEFTVEVPLVDNCFFGLIFSSILAAVVLSTGVGLLLSAIALLLSLLLYLLWAQKQAGLWIESAAAGADANAQNAN
ncbi:hypothetical protein RQP53_14765 [Paucibacter sp. APW11]|uniref:Uncharacterized protein n=1 Tax=Roseateles aquae TaxID=3077235 RepID=A0ABU3PD64_9BURK|nr:hypothetical protein [Paucibacter sp. APW11]MDT9000533.1 hypothetical protein [Paucibacter sp. APW11]